MTDAIHNFHPQYSSYTQYSSGEYEFSNFFIFQSIISLCMLYVLIMREIFKLFIILCHGWSCLSVLLVCLCNLTSAWLLISCIFFCFFPLIPQ